MPSHAATILKPPSNLDLAGWWTFDEGTSTTAGDFSGRGNTGTLVNFASPATASSGWSELGKRGRALSFDGINDYFNINQPPVQTSPNLFTISGWINPGNQYARFITPQANGIDNWVGYDAANQRLEFFITEIADVNNRGRYSAMGSVPLNRWTHFAVSINDKSIKIYINGSLDSSYTESINVGGWSGTWVIGQRGNSAEWYLGKLDDLRVYAAELSLAQISTIYKSTEIVRNLPNNLGLVGYWPMNEGTSTFVGDFSGRGAHATFSGAPLWSAGKRGGALDFDGTDDYLVTPLSRSDYSSITVAAWFKYEGSVSDSYRAIVAGQSANFFIGKNTGNGNIGVQDGAYNSAVAVGTNAWDGNWHHIAYAFSGGTGTVYLDGANVGSGAFAGGTGAIWIGQENEGGGYDFNGKIDDVRVYGRALSAEEIKALYGSNETLVNAPQDKKLTDGLVGYWTFNGKDLAGTVASDVSGRGNSGTLTNGPVPSIGKVGQSLQFDGSNDYVQVPYSAALAPTSAVSFGTWFKTTNKTLSQKILSKTESGGYAIVINEAVGSCNGTSLVGFVGVLAPGMTYFGACYDRSNITDNQWHHVMTTYDGETVLLYLDGAQVASNATPSGPITYSTNNTLCIGTEPSATCGVTQFFSGNIDEARVYNRALSAAEVKQLYLMGK